MTKRDFMRLSFNDAHRLVNEAEEAAKHLEIARNEHSHPRAVYNLDRAFHQFLDTAERLRRMLRAEERDPFEGLEEGETYGL